MVKTELVRQDKVPVARIAVSVSFAPARAKDLAVRPRIAASHVSMYRRASQH